MGNYTSVTSSEAYAVNVINSSLAPLSFASLLLVVIVMHLMNKTKKGVMILLRNLALSEMINDIALIMNGSINISSSNSNINSITSIVHIEYFFLFFGDLSAIMYITITIGMIYYVIYTGKVIDVYKYRYYIYVCAHIMPLFVAVYQFKAYDLLAFILGVNLFRAVIIFVDVALLLAMVVDYYRSSRMVVIKKTIKNLIFYPMLLSIERGVAMWDVYVIYVLNKNNEVAAVLSTVLIASIGLSCSIVFFTTQKGTFDRLYSLLTCKENSWKVIDEPQIKYGDYEESITMSYFHYGSSVSSNTVPLDSSLTETDDRRITFNMSNTNSIDI